MDGIPPELTGDLHDRICAGLLRIDATRWVDRAKRPKPAELVAAAYDVCATELSRAGRQLTEALIVELIPEWTYRWATARGWLSELLMYVGRSIVPASEAARKAFVRNSLGGRIRYWQAEMLAPTIAEPAIAESAEVDHDVPEACAAEVNPDLLEGRARQEREKRKRLLARALGQRDNQLGDVAHEVGVSRTTIYRWVQNPSLVGTKKRLTIPSGLRRIADGKRPT